MRGGLRACWSQPFSMGSASRGFPLRSQASGKTQSTYRHIGRRQQHRMQRLFPLSALFPPQGSPSSWARASRPLPAPSEQRPPSLPDPTLGSEQGPFPVTKSTAHRTGFFPPLSILHSGQAGRGPFSALSLPSTPPSTPATALSTWPLPSASVPHSPLRAVVNPSPQAPGWSPTPPAPPTMDNSQAHHSAVPARDEASPSPAPSRKETSLPVWALGCKYHATQVETAQRLCNVSRAFQTPRQFPRKPRRTQSPLQMKP